MASSYLVSVACAIFIVFPNGRMNVSAGFDCGCNGGIFCRLIPLLSAKLSMALELKGVPLSEICFRGLPRLSYILASAGRTFSELVLETRFAAGYLDARS